MRETATYGDLSTIATKPVLMLLVNHPDLIREVLVANHQKIGRGNQVFSVMEYLMGDGVALTDGSFHTRQRRLMQPQFHHRRIEDYAKVMIEHSILFRDGWKDETKVEMESEMTNLTLPIIAQVLFNVNFPDLVARIGQSFKATNDYLYLRMAQPSGFRRALHKLPLPTSRRFKRELKFLDDTVYGLIKEYRNSRDGSSDMMSLLLQATDEEAHGSDGNGGIMSDKQVRDEIITLFFAGHETTAGTLTWAWHLLSKHPEVQDRFHDELDRVLGARTVALEDLPNLAFTEQILTETLRLYPPLWTLGRMVFEPVELGGYHIPAGVTLMVSPLTTQRDPRWFAEPEAFKPERWTPEFRQDLHRFAYFPFSAGPNLCIGEGVAWMEMKIILATLGQHWRVHPDPNHQVKLEPHLTLRSKEGLPLNVERRK